MTKAKLPTIRKAREHEHFPAMLVGARIEVAEMYSTTAWEVEFMGIRHDGKREYCVWCIDGFYHYDYGEFRKEWVRRGFRSKFKIMAFHQIWKPSSQKQADELRKFNELNAEEWRQKNE